MGEKHAQHLKATIFEHYEITEDWGGTKFKGIDLEWNYFNSHKDYACRLSIKNYIRNLLLWLGHIKPTKKQVSSHKHRKINYGANEQYTHTLPPSPALDEKECNESTKLWAPSYFTLAQSTTNYLLQSTG